MNVIGAVVYGIIIALGYSYAFKKNKKSAKSATKKGGRQFLKQFPFLLSIFLLIGLFNVFIPKSVIMTFMGSSKGFFSIIWSAIVGTIAMGSVSSTYPLGAMLLNKGATIASVAVFLNTWVMVGIVTIPYEISVFGKRFTLVRNVLGFIGAIIVGMLTGLILRGHPSWIF